MTATLQQHYHYHFACLPLDPGGSNSEPTQCERPLDQDSFVLCYIVFPSLSHLVVPSSSSSALQVHSSEQEGCMIHEVVVD